MAKKEKNLLWRTRMSIDALQGNLPAAMPVMLASAAPYFGRTTTVVQFVDDQVRRNATVELAPPQILEMEPPAYASGVEFVLDCSFVCCLSLELSAQ